MSNKIVAIALTLILSIAAICFAEDAPVIIWEEHVPNSSTIPAPTMLPARQTGEISDSWEEIITANPASVPWPIIEISRKAVEKTGAWDDSRVFGYFGPGREFLSVAYFRWSHINNPYSLFTLGEYTLIDFNYPTRPDWHGRISAFINSTSIENRSGTIDMEELKLESYPATLLQKTTPRFGPGEEYALISDDINIISSSVELESGSSVLVFFEANDWAFIEFTCQKKEDNKTITGTARGWIPKVCVNNSEDAK